MKKSFILGLAILLITGLFTTACDPDNVGGNKAQSRQIEKGGFIFEENGEGFTLTGCDRDKIGTSITIPAEINGKPVTAIGDGAFLASYPYIDAEPDGNLKSVIIPKSVTSIGRYAFHRNKLTEVIIPESVISIEEHAFSKNQLTELSIPKSVTSIGRDAFSQNQLTEVIIPEGITTIEDLVFSNNQLTKVIIPNSVTIIGSSAFARNQLAEVNIPDGVKIISAFAFSANKLTAVNIPKSVNHIWMGAFSSNKLTTVNIPEGVISIGNYAFVSNDLTTLAIPESIAHIGASAFKDNYGLNLINIGENVTLGANIALDMSKDYELVVFPNEDYVPSVFDIKHNDKGDIILFENFDYIYNNGGKQAGTYILDGNGWEKKK